MEMTWLHFIVINIYNIYMYIYMYSINYQQTLFCRLPPHQNKSLNIIAKILSPLSISYSYSCSYLMTLYLFYIDLIPCNMNRLLKYKISSIDDKSIEKTRLIMIVPQSTNHNNPLSPFEPISFSMFYLLFLGQRTLKSRTIQEQRLNIYI